MVGSDAPGQEDRLIRLSANGDLDTGFAGGGIVPLGLDSGTAGTGAAAGSADGALTLSGVRVTNRVFAVGRKATPRLGQAQAARRRKRGTAFLFKLNRAAAVTIRIKRLASTRTARRRARVVRLKRAGHAAGNRVRFSGRVGRRVLRPGRYRATLIGVDGTGSRSKPQTVRFRISR